MGPHSNPQIAAMHHKCDAVEASSRRLISRLQAQQQGAHRHRSAPVPGIAMQLGHTSHKEGRKMRE
jgi:hypothetical protein